MATITPSAIAIAHTIQEISLSPGETVLQPSSAVTHNISIRTPGFVGIDEVGPSQLSLGLSVQAPTLVPGEATLEPDQVVMLIVGRLHNIQNLSWDQSVTPDNVALTFVVNPTTTHPYWACPISQIKTGTIPEIDLVGLLRN
jgi:hypothetical protein